jgi:hypothetical protein
MEIQFKRWVCDLNFESYVNGNRAFTLTNPKNGERIAVCTINLNSLTEDELAIKDYSENQGMYQTLLDYKIIEPAHRFEDSGYIKNIPICYLNWKPETYD